jgi:dTDP-4-amino-4,6-dideoxygalactose transaminase
MAHVEAGDAAAGRSGRGVPAPGRPTTGGAGGIDQAPGLGAFERAFADAHEVTTAVAVAPGANPLVEALRALGIGRGDEVVVPALAPAAIETAVLTVGARPTPADVDADTLLLVEATVRAVRTSRTRAVVVSHLLGHLADPRDVAAWRAAGLLVVEDAGAAYLTRRDGVGVGTMGHAAAFQGPLGDEAELVGCDGVVAFGEPGRAVPVARTVAATRTARHPRGRPHADVSLRLQQALAAAPAATAARLALAERIRLRLEGTDIRFVPWADGDAHRAVALRLAPDDRRRAAQALARAGVEIDDALGAIARPSSPDWRRAMAAHPRAWAAASELLVLPLDNGLTATAVDGACRLLATVVAGNARSRRPASLTRSDTVTPAVVRETPVVAALDVAPGAPVVGDGATSAPWQRPAAARVGRVAAPALAAAAAVAALVLVLSHDDPIEASLLQPTVVTVPERPAGRATPSTASAAPTSTASAATTTGAPVVVVSSTVAAAAATTTAPVAGTAAPSANAATASRAASTARAVAAPPAAAPAPVSTAAPPVAPVPPPPAPRPTAAPASPPAPAPAPTSPPTPPVPTPTSPPPSPVATTTPTTAPPAPTTTVPRNGKGKGKGGGKGGDGGRGGGGGGGGGGLPGPGAVIDGLLDPLDGLGTVLNPSQ